MSQLPSSATIDFRRSLPPSVPGLHAHWANALTALAHDCDLAMLTQQSTARGSEADRAAGARFLEARIGARMPLSRVIVTNGTQSAILLLLRGLLQHGELIVAERLSYGPLRTLAQIAGARVQGLEIDDHGIVPESFLAACRSAQPKVLYCNPTIQNPTTAVMPEDRRIAIAEIARRYGVTIIEDDALGRLHSDAPRPIASLAPDVTWYVMGTTKCLTQGLRLAYVIAPVCATADRVVAPVEHLSYWHPAPLHAATVTRWIDTGVADLISSAIAAECCAREAIAREILDDCRLVSKNGSMHGWLQLPAGWTGPDFARAAERRGILLRSAELFAVDDQATPAAIRLSLSTPETLQDVRRGLEDLKAMLQERYIYMRNA